SAPSMVKLFDRLRNPFTENCPEDPRPGATPGPEAPPINCAVGTIPGSKKARSSEVRIPGNGRDNNGRPAKIQPRVAVVEFTNCRASDSIAGKSVSFRGGTLDCVWAAVGCVVCLEPVTECALVALGPGSVREASLEIKAFRSLGARILKEWPDSIRFSKSFLLDAYVVRPAPSFAMSIVVAPRLACSEGAIDSNPEGRRILKERWDN